MSVIDDVKARLDIVDVIGAMVPLTKSGRNFKANCPFHNERTPSFYVFPDRQSWHCFGACATGGDVFSFVAKRENLDFGGALRMLAERAGVELHGNDGPRREEAKTLQDANEAAALYFQSLLGNAPQARAYIEERGLDKETVADFQIGYAPAGWENLRNHLTNRGFAEAKLIEAGLLIESDRGPNAYDRFRDRLMIPIRDDRGRVIGFGGRVLPGKSDGSDTGPKYINTPQTPIFDKGGVLYALDRSKDEIRRAGVAVIVEGYMDVIAAHQHGHRNVVASMGTSLTDRQAGLLRRFADRIVLAMDADEAGSAANLRGVQVVAAASERPARPGEARTTPHRLDIRVVALPQGKDPDELIRADAEAWPAAVASARPVIDHFYDVSRRGKDLSSAQDRQALIDEMIPVITALSNSVEQADWIQRIAGGRAREDEIWRQVRRSRGQTRVAARRQMPASETPSNPSAPSASMRSRNPREEFCLSMLLKVESLRESGEALDESLFTLSENRELYRRWRSHEPVSEDEYGLWEQYQHVLQTTTPQIEMGLAEKAFTICVAGLTEVRMRAVKEASALALAEGMAGVRPGQVASIARTRMESGLSEASSEDSATEAAASLLLEDYENSLKLFERTSDSARSEHNGQVIS